MENLEYGISSSNYDLLIGPLSSIASPMTLMIRPSVALPTGTCYHKKQSSSQQIKQVQAQLNIKKSVIQENLDKKETAKMKVLKKLEDTMDNEAKAKMPCSSINMKRNRQNNAGK